MTRTSRILSLLAGLLAAISLSLGLARLWRRLAQRVQPGGLKQSAQRLAWQRANLAGLSESEAASRKTDHFAQERTALQKKRRRHTIQTAVFSIFNLTLVVLAFSQIWLDDFWGALGTLGVLAFNIVLIIVQQEFALRQVKTLLGQPGAVRAPVIREGRIRSLDLADVVIGDLLAAGKGDEILVEGILLGSRSVELQEPGVIKKTRVARPGETLIPGSVILTGEALYEVRQLPSFLPSQLDRQLPGNKKKTPLERLLQSILYALLIFAGLFYALILLQIWQIEVLSPELLTFYRDTMATVFSLVPAGFFLMILVNYAMGSIDMARQGILVRETRKVEALAELHTLFFLHTRALLNIQVNLENLPGWQDSGLDENLVRRALGDLAHSASGRDVYLEVLAEEFPGEAHPLKEEAFFFSLVGWGGGVMDQPEMGGTFVLGYPQVLKPYLVKDEGRRQKDEEKKTEDGRQKPGEKAGWRGRVSKLFKRRKKGDDAVDEAAAEAGDRSEELIQPGGEMASSADLVQAGGEMASSAKLIRSGGEVASSAEMVQAGTGEMAAAGGDGGNGKFADRLKTNLRKLGDRIEIIQGIPQAIEGSQSKLLDLVLAYHPKPVSFYLPDGSLVCPDGLIPLCRLSFSQQVAPAVRSIIERFQKEGVAFKLMTNLSKELAETHLRSLGILTENNPPEDVISAKELERIGDRKVVLARVITDAGPPQISQVIQAYHRSGLKVGALSNDFTTWESLRLADVSIAAKDSDQALTAQADIVLTKKSLAPLNPLLERGQQIVNGTLDVMRLNLVQLFYTLAILLVTFFLGSTIIPFNSSQGGMIALFSVTIPAAVMSFWAPKGRVNQFRMSRVLMRFVLPASLWIALAAVLLFYRVMPAYENLVYPRHMVTHALVCMGTLVALFARPPVGWLAAGVPLAVDRRPSLVVGVSFLLWNVLVWIPLAQKYLLIAPLNSLQDYGLVWLLSLVVGVLIQLTWKIVK